MQKKFAFLLVASLALLTVNQAFAQSSHDAVSGHDSDHANSVDNDFSLATADGKYRMRVRGHVQQNNRFSYTPNPGKSDLDIEIKRARLSVLGNVFDPRLTYLFQVGLEKDPQIEKTVQHRSPGSELLRDYYFNFSVIDRHLQVRAGKFRTPFSRQQLISTSQMQFYDQSLVNGLFQLTDSGRDVGVMLHNGYANTIEWAFASVSNGLVARVGYNHNGIDGYETSDFDGGPLRFAVAGNGFFYTDYKSAKVTDFRAGADFILKIHGFSTNGAVYYGHLKNQDGQGMNNFGLGADFGYLLKKKYEPVLRYSWSRLDTAQALNLHEVLVGFNYYIYGHHLKLQGYAGPQLANSSVAKWLGGAQVQFAL